MRCFGALALLVVAATSGTSAAAPRQSISGLVVQPDDRVVVVGTQASRGVVVRYLADGRLDTGFGIAGTAQLPFEPAAAAARQADGAIVVVGGSRRFSVARLRPDGRLDPSFGTDGVVTTSFGARSTGQPYVNAPSAVAVQSDGRIVVGGRSCLNAALARYLPDGRPDPAFGTAGLVTAHLGSTDYSAFAQIALQRDGKIVATVDIGPNPGSVGVVRFSQRGTPDVAFGRRGSIWYVIGSQADEHPSALLVRNDNRIVVGGFGRWTGPTPPKQLGAGYGTLTQLTPQGSLDRSFSGTGKRVFPDYVNGLAPQGAKLLVLGSSIVDRITTTGRLDPSFNRIALNLAGGAIGVQGTGSIVVASSGRRGFVLARYRHDG